MEAFIKPPELKLEKHFETEWKFFMQKFKIYLTAVKIKQDDEEYKCAVLLNCVGDKALKIFNTFEFEAGESSKYSKVVEKFEAFFVPMKNVTYERYVFLTREMKDNESVDEYVTQLRQLSDTCEFSSLSESLIKDRLVLGIRDKNVKNRLLRTKNLDLVKAIEICKSAEITKTQMQVLCEGTSSMSTSEMDNQGVLQVRKMGRSEKGNQRSQSQQKEIYTSGVKREANGGFWRNGQRRQHSIEQAQIKISKNSKQTPNVNKFDCSKCGSKHLPRECRAYGKKCNACGRYNHFAQYCYNRSVNNIVKEEDELFICMVNEGKSNKNRNKWEVDLNIFDRLVNFKVDSGADVNVISWKLYKEYFKDIQIKQENTKLSEYSGAKLEIIGYVVVPVKYKNCICKLKLFITKANSPSVLGREAIEQLNVAKMVCGISESENYVKNYEDVFNGIGCLPGHYKIKVDPSVKPSVHAARKFPQGILVKLKNKLEKLEEQSIIVKEFGPTEWVNSLVIVDKPSGDFRICIDPTDLNKAIKREYFTIPTYTDTVSKLKDAKVFSVLDTRHGFWNIQLDESSSKLCTFNTPFGRYRFKRLPFGLKCSTEVFQRKIMQCFENLEGVEIYVDDILVWGTDKEEHDKRLKIVLDRARKFNIKFNPDKSLQ